MQHLVSAYKRNNLFIVRGEGSFLFDDSGNKYLDFATGIAVNGLGHGNKYINDKLKEQIDRLWHCSNLFRIEGQENYAQRLCDISFADRVFFCSSGLEANEAAVKFIRKYHHDNHHFEKDEIIVFNDGFHGRSIAMLSACSQTKAAHEGFYPLVKGFKSIAKTMDEIEESINEKTLAVMFELVQSEGGVHAFPQKFVDKIVSLCKKHKALIFVDEVQTAFGRTGEMFAYQKYGFTPDIITCAKSIGNGFPLAACLLTETVACCITPGTHGGTYGGNPLACAVGNAVLDEIENKQIINHVKEYSGYFAVILNGLADEYHHIIKEARHIGFFGALELHDISAKEFITLALSHGLLITSCGSDKVVRILPPLNATKLEFDLFKLKISFVLKQIGEN